MHSSERSIEGSLGETNGHKWWLLVPVLLLSCFSAYLFVKFLGATFFYSDWGPLTSTTPANRVPELTYASHRAHVLFLSSVAVAALAALLMAPVIQLSGISSAGFRLLARYLVALVLFVLTTGVLVWVMGILRLG